MMSADFSRAFRAISKSEKKTINRRLYIVDLLTSEGISQFLSLLGELLLEVLVLGKVVQHSLLDHHIVFYLKLGDNV